MALSVQNYDSGTISGVTTDPNWTGTLAVDGGDATLNGPLQGGDVYLQGGSLPADSGSYSTGGSGGYTAPAPPVYVDPYAKWGGIDAYNNLVAGFNAEDANINTSASQSADLAASNYRSGILDYLEKASQQQKSIDAQRYNNELAKMNGVEGIRGMVGRGINSAGVMLGNRNAGDSSAAGAIARAYGQLGQRQMAGVGNQYAQGQQGIELAQSELAGANATQQRHNEETKQNFITTTINTASAAIRDLNLRRSQADIPGQIAIDQRIEQIRNDANAKLNAFDQEWSSGVSKLVGVDRNTAMSKAQEMRQAGTDLGNNAFNFTEQAPMTFQGNAPAGGNMPLYTMPRGGGRDRA